MTALRVIAIDDEPLALRRLQLVLDRIPGVDLVGTARTISEGQALISKLQPDAMLLDIQLGDRTSFEILDAMVGRACPDVVFVTAFAHHAARAFERNAVDYVLKPVDATRLEEALGRVRMRADSADADERIRELRAVVDALRQSEAHTPGHETEFWIRRGGSDLVRVPVDVIEAASAEEDYVRLFGAGRSWLMRETLTGLERRFPPGEFVRVHRAHLVRLSQITELRRRPAGGLEAVLVNGMALPVGRINARALRRKFVPGGAAATRG